jgi:uncharacterized protein
MSDGSARGWIFTTKASERFLEKKVNTGYMLMVTQKVKTMNSEKMIGVISDTHGLLRPAALEALEGSRFVIHAGDIDRPEVLERLRRIAPVVAVRGNMDRGDWARNLPLSDMVDIADRMFYVIHNMEEMDLDPIGAGISVVITGHSHRPGITRKNGVLYLNPGSAGPRRFELPVTVGRLTMENGRLHPEIIHLSL